jgi:hypothetical protein
LLDNSFQAGIFFSKPFQVSDSKGISQETYNKMREIIQSTGALTLDLNKIKNNMNYTAYIIGTVGLSNSEKESLKVLLTDVTKRTKFFSNPFEVNNSDGISKATYDKIREVADKAEAWVEGTDKAWNNKAIKDSQAYKDYHFTLASYRGADLTDLMALEDEKVKAFFTKPFPANEFLTYYMHISTKYYITKTTYDKIREIAITLGFLQDPNKPRPADILRTTLKEYDRFLASRADNVKLMLQENLTYGDIVLALKKDWRLAKAFVDAYKEKIKNNPSDPFYEVLFPTITKTLDGFSLIKTQFFSGSSFPNNTIKMQFTFQKLTESVNLKTLYEKHKDYFETQYLDPGIKELKQKTDKAEDEKKKLADLEHIKNGSAKEEVLQEYYEDFLKDLFVEFKKQCLPADGKPVSLKGLSEKVTFFLYDSGFFTPEKLEAATKNGDNFLDPSKKASLIEKIDSHGKNMRKYAKMKSALENSITFGGW